MPSHRPPKASRRSRNRIQPEYPELRFQRRSICCFGRHCYPATTIKATFVCWRCPQTARATLVSHASPDEKKNDPRLLGTRNGSGQRMEVRCPGCRAEMHELPVTIHVPSPKHTNAWRKFERWYRETVLRKAS